MAETHELVSDTDDGIAMPCFERCADPCQDMDCGCEDFTVEACVERETCPDPDETDSPCSPGHGVCDFWDRLHFFGVVVGASILLRAAQHGGIAQLEIYAGGGCPVGDAIADRIIASPFTGGACPNTGTPIATLTREDIDPVGCATCNPVTQYKIAFVVRADDDTALACCTYCISLGDDACSSSSSGSDGSSSPSSSAGSSSSSAPSSSAASSSGASSGGGSGGSSGSSGSSGSGSSSGSYRVYIVDTYDDTGDGLYYFDSVSDSREMHVKSGGGWRLRYNPSATQWLLEKEVLGYWTIKDTALGATQYPSDPSLSWSSGLTTVTVV